MQSFQSVIVAPQRWLDPFHREFRPGLSNYAPGGKYLEEGTLTDLTEQSFLFGVIDVSDGKATFEVSTPSAPRTKKDGRIVRSNLFKKKAGWYWTSCPERYAHIETLVSVETGGKHYYALQAEFKTGVTLSRYPKAKSEPRLRPTTYGTISFGPVVGTISVRGVLHHVCATICVI